jgi:hypothetical protein
VEGEPLRRAVPDPRQAGKLSDELVDERPEHRLIVPRRIGRTVGSDEKLRSDLALVLALAEASGLSLKEAKRRSKELELS